MRAIVDALSADADGARGGRGMSDSLERRLRLPAEVDLRNGERGKAGYAVTLIRAGDTLLGMLMGA
jgi:hypothetical protein